MTTPESFVRKMGSRPYYSQAGQDLFVLAMLNEKHQGHYCEIGGAHPFDSNNTFLLESKYGWKGIAVELDPSLASIYSAARQNPCFTADATTFSYAAAFAEHSFPSQIDYISVDIDPAPITFQALETLPFNDYRFSVITYEHDAYTSGPEHMERSRLLLKSKGYQLVAANVRCFGRDFEDWWVDPTVVPESTWAPFRSQGAEFSNLFA